MGLGEFFYAGKSTRDFNIYCSGAGTYSAPSRKYTAVEIPGKNGVKLEDEESFSNAPILYKCLIMGDVADYDRFRSFLMAQRGYQRLEDSFHPDEFRYAALAESLSPKIKGSDDVASFKLEFSALPERWLKSGERAIPISASGVIVNNTDYESEPLIRVLGNGTVTINGTSFTVSNVDGYVDVDCAEMDAYKGSTNMNGYFTGSFPKLKPGPNTITCTAAIEIKPRWYTI